MAKQRELLSTTAPGDSRPLIAAKARTDELLSDIEAAAILKKSPGTLARWRCHHKGPRFIRSGRTVLYLRGDLENYLLNGEPSPPEPRRRLRQRYAHREVAE